MLPSARQGWTANQVEAVLRSPTGRLGTRFELLDNGGNVVDYFDVAPPGVLATTPGTILEAKVEQDGERKLIGSLDLRMLPDDRLRNAAFQYRIRPVSRFGPMPDGSMMEWNCGTYVWAVPERDIAPGVEEWDVTLADGLFDFDSGGPGTTGFQVFAGEAQTDAIRRVLNLAGYHDESGIKFNNGLKFVWPRSFGLTRPQQGWGFMYLPDWEQGWGFYSNGSVMSVGDDPSGTRTNTLLDIQAELHAGIGYQPPRFNWDGVFQAQPANDWTIARPSVTFGTAQDGVVLTPIHTSNDLSKFCNRVFAWSEASGTAYFFTSADANDVIPGHPLSQGVIKRYADKFITDSTADSQEKADQQVRAALLAGLATYQRVTFDTMAWPMLEPFDVIGVYIAGDNEFNSVKLFEERKVSWDLITGVMSHEAAATFQVN